MWGDNPAQLQELFNKYGTANNVKVVVNAPVEEDKVIAGLSGSEPPDVLILSGVDNVGSWTRQGLIVPLDDLIAANKIDLTDIFPAPLDQCKYLGKYSCLPWGTDMYALYYNKDLFEAAGLDPEKPPETLEQLVEYADKLTVKDTSGDYTQFGFVPDFPWGHSDLFARMFGGFWYSEDGTKVTFSSAPMVEAFQWQAQFYTKYGADNVLKFSSGMGDYNSPDQGFYAGRVAMYVDGEWQPGPNFIKKFKPELNYGVAPFPYPKDHPELKNMAVAQGTVAVIPAGAKNKDASAKLLAWMMSPEIVAEEMYTNFNLPTSKKAAQDPRFHENKKFELFLNLMDSPNASHIIYSPISAEVNTELGSLEEQILHAGGDAAALTKAADEKLQPQLDAAYK